LFQFHTLALGLGLNGFATKHVRSSLHWRQEWTYPAAATTQRSSLIDGEGIVTYVRTPYPGIVLNEHSEGDGDIVFQHSSRRVTCITWLIRERLKVC
jgi:hypothetical protein